MCCNGCIRILEIRGRGSNPPFSTERLLLIHRRLGPCIELENCSVRIAAIVPDFQSGVRGFESHTLHVKRLLLIHRGPHCLSVCVELEILGYGVIGNYTWFWSTHFRFES